MAFLKYPGAARASLAGNGTHSMAIESREGTPPELPPRDKCCDTGGGGWWLAGLS